MYILYAHQQQPPKPNQPTRKGHGMKEKKLDLHNLVLMVCLDNLLYTLFFYIRW